MAPRRLVVAAAIVDDLGRPTRVLAGRRTGPPSLAGMWELPGGKVEPDEDAAAALHREIGEELGVRVRLGAELVPPDQSASGTARATTRADDSGWVLSATLQMRVWFAAVVAGQIATSTDHDRLRWVGANEVAALDWLPGDRPIVDALWPLLRAR